LCVPYATLEPIRDTLYSTLQGDAIETDKRWVSLLTRQIESAELDITAELGNARATIAELMALKPGDFIELDLPETIQAMSNGVPMFECRYGLSNGHYAIRIQDFLTLPSGK
jgi:flagellar motor switch protein FliM